MGARGARGKVFHLAFERLISEAAAGDSFLDATRNLFQQLDPAFEVLDGLR